MGFLGFIVWLRKFDLKVFNKIKVPNTTKNNLADLKRTPYFRKIENEITVKQSVYNTTLSDRKLTMLQSPKYY